MIKTAKELKEYFDTLNIPKIGQTVSVVGESGKYEKATVISEITTKPFEIAKYKVSLGKSKFVEFPITAIHSNRLIVQIAHV